MSNDQEEALDKIGRLADRCDNFAAASKLPMPDKFHREQLTEAMADIAKELKAIYVSLTGNDPWTKA